MKKGDIMAEISFIDSYKEYYIIYFDVLGYKAFFEKSNSIEKIKDYYEKITSGIETIIDAIQEQNKLFIPSSDRFCYRIFSDNICIFIKSTNDKYDLLKFMQIINLSSQIQRFFMFELGLLIRGSITKGRIIDNNKCIFGEGLIDAVMLESQAIYPRIYIPNAKVIAPLFNISIQLAQRCQCEMDLVIYRLFIEIYNCLLEENEQFFYLDYLRDFNIKQFFTDDMKNEMIKFVEQTNNEEAEFLEKTKNQKTVEYPKDAVIYHFINLIKMVSEYSGYHYNGNDDKTQKIVEKLVWTLKYHNKTCEKAGLKDFLIKYNANKDVDNKIQDFKLKTKLEDILG